MRRRSLVACLIGSALAAGHPALAQEPPPPAAPAPIEQPPPPAAPPAEPAPAPAAPPAEPPPPPAPPPQMLPPEPAPPPPAYAPPPSAVAPPAAPPPSADPPPGAPPPGAPPAEDKDKKDEVRDGVRARGGFSVNGGAMILPNASVGPAFGFGGRIGVQFNHYFGLVYQNTPIVTFTPQYTSSGGILNMSAGFKAGFADYNSLMAMLTLGHFFDLGAGPSLDFLAVANGSATIMGQSVTSSSGISPGGHARVAFNIGGLSGNGPRRSGFAIGGDFHVMHTPGGLAGSLTIGLGAEWY